MITENRISIKKGNRHIEVQVAIIITCINICSKHYFLHAIVRHCYFCSMFYVYVLFLHCVSKKTSPTFLARQAQQCGWLNQTGRVKIFVNYGESDRKFYIMDQNCFSTQDKNCIIAKQKQ